MLCIMLKGEGGGGAEIILDKGVQSVLGTTNFQVREHEIKKKGTRSCV